MFCYKIGFVEYRELHFMGVSTSESFSWSSLLTNSCRLDSEACLDDIYPFECILETVGFRELIFFELLRFSKNSGSIMSTITFWWDLKSTWILLDLSYYVELNLLLIEETKWELLVPDSICLDYIIDFILNAIFAFKASPRAFINFDASSFAGPKFFRPPRRDGDCDVFAVWYLALP